MYVNSLKPVNKYSAYLFAYFKGERRPQGEQVYFAVSKDGFHWTDLNSGKPILISTLGEKGIRDPFIIRSHDGSKFYLIGTDLKIYGSYDWNRAQVDSSQSIMIWESSDLINWSEQRMVRVAPEGAGCTFAPEAIYNDKTEEYVIFWSSTIPKKDDKLHRVYFTTTKDFVNFEKAKIWIELKNQNGNLISVIDADVIKVGDMYYRFIKNESHEAHKEGMPKTGRYVIMEKSNDLFGDWEEISSKMSQIKYVEGPAIFKMNNKEKWILFLDSFTRSGYFPLVSKDLDSGIFRKVNSNRYSLPSVMRHGSVISLTEDEYKAVTNRYS